MKTFNENESIINHEVEVTGLSVKEVLKEGLHLSSRLLYKLDKSKSIYLNHREAKLSKITGTGDILSIKMEDEKENIQPQHMTLDIVYEDFDLIIINKEPYKVVHPTKGHQDGTIANGIAYYFQEQHIHKKVRFVNRLDMDTSGILVVAKNPYGHQQMAQQFQEDKVKKRYLAVVEGILKEDKGEIDQPIGKDEDHPIRNKVIQGGKPSITRYRVMERYKGATLVEVDIATGRTHQIRVHLDYLGHPIIGDTLYNKENEWINRQALHSYSLQFRKPREGKDVIIKAELPKDIKALINRLR